MLKDAWTLAIESLSWIELQSLGERLAVAKASKQLRITDSRSLGLAHKLVFETQRRLNAIDSTINSALAPHSISEFKLGVQSFLRLYTYSLKFENSDFKQAAAMAQTGRSILGWQELNDIEEALGKVLSEQLASVFRGTNDEERVALQTYNPVWFVKYCFKMLGRNGALNFLNSVSRPTPTYVRLNSSRASEEESLKQLEEEGVTVEKVPLLKHAYKVAKSEKPLLQTRSVREGLLYVQDKSSCLAAEVANPKAGDTVIDVCAAPGAKTTYMAQLMLNQGRIYSIDYSRRRMNVWSRETNRMGAKNASAIIADAQKPLPLNIIADKVVLDPPCTSTGTFGKTPSAKWRLTKRSAFTMAEIQWNMLNNCAEMVREDGHLIYSTCSITLEENEMLIERFLKWHSEFTLAETLPKIGLPGLRGLAQCQRLYPHLHACNGFFIAKMTKE